MSASEAHRKLLQATSFTACTPRNWAPYNGPTVPAQAR